MVRLLAIVLMSLLIGLVAIQIWRQARGANVDWNGLAFAAGFVVLAFYLRHVTEIG